MNEHTRRLPRTNEDVFAYYERLRSVRSFVVGNLAGDLSRDRVARIANMDGSSFSTFFKSKTGLHYSDWIRTLRVEHAKHLIERRNAGLASVARSAGFGSTRSLRRAFKTIEGITPGQYRVRNRPDLDRPARPQQRLRFDW